MPSVRDVVAVAVRRATLTVVIKRDIIHRVDQPDGHRKLTPDALVPLLGHIRDRWSQHVRGDAKERRHLPQREAHFKALGAIGAPVSASVDVLVLLPRGLLILGGGVGDDDLDHDRP